MGKTPFLSTFFVLLLLAVFNVAKAGVKDSIGVTRINNALHVRYLVSPGETIYGISTRYHVSVSDLLELNPELEGGLKVGQVINIPYNEALLKKSAESNTAKTVHKVQVHKVQSGETLYSLAKKYNVTLDQLMKWNNMDLKVGQEIVVGYQSVSATKPVVETQSAQPEPAKAPEKKKDDFEFTEPRKEEKKETAVVKTETVQPKQEVAPAVTLTKQEPAPAKQSQPEVAKQDQIIIKTEEDPASATYAFDPEMQQVLIIPFDPYLYFSDADHEIAAKSKIAPTRVREVFRRRLTALMQAPGYETIYLLGGRAQDSISDLNKIYSSVTYNFQNVVSNPYYKGGAGENNQGALKGGSSKSWLDKQKEKLTAGNSAQTSSKAVYDKHEGQYFGVKIRNPEEFFNYFTTKYSVDYYVFINQFEVKTNYENCLDRSANNFERTFTTHFSMFDASGNQIAGNKFKTFYNSNSNYVYTIVADNMEKIAQRILAELPPPGK